MNCKDKLNSDENMTSTIVISEIVRATAMKRNDE